MDKTNSMGDSLVNRHVYSVCCTSVDDVFHSDLYKLRKSFFEGGMKKCSLKSSSQDTGLDVKIRGRMSKRSLKWKKTSGKLSLEEAFSVAKNHVVVKRDLNGSICGKITFDEDMEWIKTEYFSSGDYMQATTILKPDSTKNAIEKFTYSKTDRRYEVESLLPIPYMYGSAEQSIVNAKNGDDFVLVATDQGEFCYCPENEHNDRMRTMEDIKAGNILMMPAWEIKDGEIPETAKDNGPEVEFKNLVDVCENTAEECSADSDSKTNDDNRSDPDGKNNSGSDTETDSKDNSDSGSKADDETDSCPDGCTDSDNSLDTDGKSESEVQEDAASSESPAADNADKASADTEAVTSGETAKCAEVNKNTSVPAEEEKSSSENDIAEFVNGVSRATEPKNAGSILPEDLSLAVENSDNFVLEKVHLNSDGEEYSYTGKMLDGRREGRGRTDQENGLTAFDGEYKDNKKDGFGAQYYKDGDMSYVGSWKEDKKDGVGISFRRKDHAIHIAKWDNGVPDAHTTLIDADGNLKYSGRIVNGKKQGAGVSYRKADDTIFVGRYTDGCADSYGSLFDNEGHLIYTGQWKNGMRNGTGTEFDKNGQIVYSGEWKDDKYLNGILYQKV